MDRTTSSHGLRTLKPGRDGHGVLSGYAAAIITTLSAVLIASFGWIFSWFHRRMTYLENNAITTRHIALRDKQIEQLSQQMSASFKAVQKEMLRLSERHEDRLIDAVKELHSKIDERDTVLRDKIDRLREPKQG